MGLVHDRVMGRGVPGRYGGGIPPGTPPPAPIPAPWSAGCSLKNKLDRKGAEYGVGERAPLFSNGAYTFSVGGVRFNGW